MLNVYSDNLFVQIMVRIHIYDVQRKATEYFRVQARVPRTVNVSIFAGYLYLKINETIIGWEGGFCLEPK